jgi:hypothetical protein
MQDPALASSDSTIWWIAFVFVVIIAIGIALVWAKGRRRPGEHVFRASRFSRGNFFFPTQVSVTPSSVLNYKPELVGGREHSIHIHHISSVLIDRNLFFSDILIETSGGTSPVRCHGHRKRDAVAMKDLIERYQSDYYRRTPERPGGAERA